MPLLVLELYQPSNASFSIGTVSAGVTNQGKKHKAFSYDLFSKMAPSYVRRWAGQRVLSEVQLDDRGHEPQLDGQSRDSVPAQVEERQLKVGNFCKKIGKNIFGSFRLLRALSFAPLDPLLIFDLNCFCI